MPRTIKHQNKSYRYKEGGSVRDADEMLAGQRASAEYERTPIAKGNLMDRVFNKGADAVDKFQLEQMDHRNAQLDRDWEERLTTHRARSADYRQRNMKGAKSSGED